MDGKYTTKKDMFGKLSFFDERGNRIGRESRGFGGMSIVIDDRGKKVADITFDEYGRRILKRKQVSHLIGKSRYETREILRIGNTVTDVMSLNVMIVICRSVAFSE